MKGYVHLRLPPKSSDRILPVNVNRMSLLDTIQPVLFRFKICLLTSKKAMASITPASISPVFIKYSACFLPFLHQSFQDDSQVH